MISGRSSTSVADYTSELRIDVDMSGCGFVKIPTITTSLEGITSHAYTTGATSVYSATTSGFYVYIRYSESSWNTGTTLRDDLGYYNWNIEWVAVGYTC